jgi:epoxyqueuosine reductase
LDHPLTDDLASVREQLHSEARALGFSGLTISAPDLHAASERLKAWINAGYHGEMNWFERSLDQRANPQQLVPGTIRVISVTLPYLDHQASSAKQTLEDSERGYVSRYALGRDYHKVMRQRLAKLARALTSMTGAAAGRVFCDSAPVMEVEIAMQSGLGWRGKHTLLLNRSEGSWFFLGEIYTSIPLPIDPPTTEHCGRCTACMDACPTGAIFAPYQVDARKCISYLTIEHPGSIPQALRPLMGNRIYGCDDCQLFCPWNKTSDPKDSLQEFNTRENLDSPMLIDLFAWTEEEFKKRLEGSPIRRIGYHRWIRNIAVAIGNGPRSVATLKALEEAKLKHTDPMLVEHIQWAIHNLQEQE